MRELGDLGCTKAGALKAWTKSFNSRRVIELARRCPVTEAEASNALAAFVLVQHGEGGPTQAGGDKLATAYEAFLIADDLAALVDTLAPLLGLNASVIFEAFHDSV